MEKKTNKSSAANQQPELIVMKKIEDPLKDQTKPQEDLQENKNSNPFSHWLIPPSQRTSYIKAREYDCL